MKTIWCLFSIENEYNQPMNNLVAWWNTKPTIEQVSEVLGYKKHYFDKVSKIIEGNEVSIGGTEYRIEEVKQSTHI